ncbi:MAG: hypothetical protein MUE53_03060 [Chitinophagales bacterium]|jgi:phosphopantetheinyl transferase|nr:hypothetical protein [Chitinophagales bacterium]
MPVIFEVNTSNYALKVWKIDEKEDFFMPFIQFSDFDTHEFAQYTHPIARLQWLASRYLLRLMLGKHRPTILIDKLKSGKPYLVHDPYHISLSHSQNYIACMLSEINYPVGLDIQVLNPKINRIKPKFIHTNDDPYYLQNDITLTQLWSIKEAIFKLKNLPNLSFRYDILVPSHLENLAKTTDLNEYQVDYHQVDEGVILAWVCEKGIVIA